MAKIFFFIVEYFDKPASDSDSSTPITSNPPLLDTLILKKQIFLFRFQDFRISEFHFSKIMQKAIFSYNNLESNGFGPCLSILIDFKWNGTMACWIHHFAYGFDEPGLAKSVILTNMLKMICQFPGRTIRYVYGRKMLNTVRNPGRWFTTVYDRYTA
jgi:hypothetical protein